MVACYVVAQGRRHGGGVLRSRLPRTCNYLVSIIVIDHINPARRLEFHRSMKVDMQFYRNSFKVNIMRYINIIRLSSPHYAFLSVVHRKTVMWILFPCTVHNLE